MTAIRGAVTVQQNTTQQITQAVLELFDAITSKNQLQIQLMSCIIISCTQDLTKANPATQLRLNRQISTTPLFCVAEHDYEGSLPLCIRLLILTNQTIPKQDVNHIYLGDAKKLREDLTND